MKKLPIILACLMLTATTASAEAGSKLFVDTNRITAETITLNDNIYLPLRSICEAIGAEITWSEADRSVGVTAGNYEISYVIENTAITVNGESIDTGLAPIIYNDYTYLPLDSFCKSFNTEADCDEITGTILIHTGTGPEFIDTTLSTVGDIIAENEQTLEAFREFYSLPETVTEEMSQNEAYYNIPFRLIAQMFGSDAVSVREMLGLGEEFTEDMRWAEVEGEVTIGNYVGEESYDDFMYYYGLGEEYTPDVKWKYVRHIIHAKDRADAVAAEEERLALERENAEYLAEKCAKKYLFTIELENGSIMSGELYPDLAPETVANFKKLADEGFYNGLLFHRVVNGFIIQGGGFDADFNNITAESIVGEFDSNGFRNPLSHTRGVISMARSSNPNSQSSEFFIVHQDSTFLDGSYAAFGRITDGFDTLDAIASVETDTNDLGMQNVPLESVVIKSITVSSEIVSDL